MCLFVSAGIRVSQRVPVCVFTVCIVARFVAVHVSLHVPVRVFLTMLLSCSLYKLRAILNAENVCF